MTAHAMVRSSKVEELQVLERFAAKQEPGTYLAGLLTERLLRWVEDQMHDDLPCDVMEALDAAHDDARMQVVKLADAKIALELAEKNAKGQSRTIVEYGQQSEDLYAKLCQARVRLVELEEQIRQLRADRDRLDTELFIARAAQEREEGLRTTMRALGQAIREAECQA